MIEADEKIANVGDIVVFERGGQEFKGRVIPSNCQRSAIVDLTIMENFSSIDFDHDRTVVAHTNYKVIETRE
ncbi:YkvS family protein [Thalassobacillus sp. CUG 92003]|uniref:YkvS family protein n=1 Tax=Thalassobacillus sp. CUG 92003 TaxID=2736641 RepID=UPI0015E654E4|nr:YkvS family protein [Thalassobacillus sp. CUG 92003]